MAVLRKYVLLCLQIIVCKFLSLIAWMEIYHSVAEDSKKTIYFIEYFFINRRDEMQRIVKDLFELFNTDDRKMSKEQRRRSSLALANSAFEEMDANADGKVTKEEFMDAVKTHEKISNMLALKIVDIFVVSDDNDEIEEEPV